MNNFKEGLILPIMGCVFLSEEICKHSSPLYIDKSGIVYDTGFVVDELHFKLGVCWKKKY